MGRSFYRFASGNADLPGKQRRRRLRFFPDDFVQPQGRQTLCQRRGGAGSGHAGGHEGRRGAKAAEAKDYIDIDALIGRGGIGLPLALAAGQRIYGQGFNPEITLKALSFFEDGDLGSVPDAIRDRLTDAVRAVDLDRLPLLARGATPRDPECRR